MGRRFVRETLRAWDLECKEEAAELAASELITNAVLHAGSSPTVRLEFRNTTLRLEVSDQSFVEPNRKHYDTEAATGRGIVLVERIASGWGTTPSLDGKTVWCEFDASDVCIKP